MASAPEVHRSELGRVLVVVIGAVCAVALVGLVVSDGAEGGLRGLPWLLLVVGACWACYWRPAVEVDDGGVRLVNVFRTIEVPWPAIRAVDTKWALTLDTAYGRFTGWAAPAPGRREAAGAGRRDAEALGTTTDRPVRPGDLPTTSSGSAALIVRRRWEALREAGHLDDPRIDPDLAPVRWHTGTFVAAAMLALASAVALLA